MGPKWVIIVVVIAAVIMGLLLIGITLTPDIYNKEKENKDGND